MCSFSDKESFDILLNKPDNFIITKILETLIAAVRYWVLQEFTLYAGYYWTFSQQDVGKCPS